MKANEFITEQWSQKYKNSINCSHPKGFSQKAHCAGKKKHNESTEMEMVCAECGMCETHGNISEIKQRLDPKCWKGKHKEGTKIKGGVRVNNCVPNESVEPGVEEAAKTEGYIFKGGFPFDVDHMPGAVHKQDLDTKKKFTDEDLWLNTVNKLNSSLYDDNSDYISSGNGYRVEIMGKVWAKWDGIKDAGWVETSSLAEGPQNVSKGWTVKYWDKQSENEPMTREFRSKEQADAFLVKLPKHYVVALRPVTQVDKDPSLDEQFDAIEEMVEAFAQHHGVDADEIWEELESVDDAELLDESAAWKRKAGKSKTGGLNKKGVASYRREHPGSKLQTAVTTKPSKLKKGSKAAKRRKSFCARMGGVKGPMKKPNGKPTRKALALRKWNCESVEQLQNMLMIAESWVRKHEGK